jgi:predicted transposase/invertase (TIGR01784 family)
MTAKPHDALFKAAFEAPEHAAGVFRSLLPPTVEGALAWDTVRHEPGSFIDPDLADRHSDLLFSIEVRETRAYLYLLLEHQSTNDDDMPLRMLIYLVRIWERYRKQHKKGPLPLIIPAMICHAPDGWTAPVAFEDLFDPHPSSIPGLAQLVPSFSLLLEDLVHLGNDELKQRALAVFPKLAMWVLRDARSTEQLLQNLQPWSEALREVLRTPHGMEAAAQLLRYIALVGGDVQFKELRAKIREQIPEAEGVAMTIAEELRQEGRAEGLRNGRAEGYRNGRVEMLEKQLLLKFGEPSTARATQIQAASDEQLERYVERILTATSIEAVFADD